MNFKCLGALRLSDVGSLLTVYPTMRTQLIGHQCTDLDRERDDLDSADRGYWERA